MGSVDPQGTGTRAPKRPHNQSTKQLQNKIDNFIVKRVIKKN